MEKFHNISDFFIATRNKLGWTQDKMARELMIDRAYLSQIENGKREPSLRLQNTLRQLASKANLTGIRYEPPGGDGATLRDEDGGDLDEAVAALEDLCRAWLVADPARRPVILTQIKIVAGSLSKWTK